MLFKPGYASLELISLDKQRKEETSKLKILRIKNTEYRDGIKSRETRPGWGEAHNVYKLHVQVPLRGFKPIRMCTWATSHKPYIAGLSYSLIYNIH